MKSNRVAFLAAVAFLVLLCSDEASATTKPCPRLCPRHIDPVCGMRANKNREFTNRCNWEAFNCANPANAYPEIVQGRCEQQQ